VVRGCNLRARPPAARGVVNVPGRGGAFVVSNDLRPVVRR
jgi:hypothetical protein